MTLANIQSSLRNGEISVKNIVSGYLQAIKTASDFNIYVRTFDEEALQKAETLDQKLISGAPLGKLFGLVISIKDVICYENHGLTAASKILEGFESQFTSTALKQLLNEDAIVIGMTNCDEFAMGSTNENSIYGATPNGIDPRLVAGGSSGGAAVSVYKKTCHIALGSDTGGSVRQPAAFHGLIGMKPTYGRVSRYGLIAYGSSFDQIGVIGEHLEDVALVTALLSGHDPMDGTSAPVPVENLFPIESKANLTAITFTEVINHPKLSENIKKDCKALFAKINQNGSLSEIEFPLLEYLVPTYYVLTTAEASSNLGRYDGVRYGKRAESIKDLESLYKKTRSEGFGTEVKRRIMLGTFVLSSGYFDAYYTKAQKVRRLITEAIEEALREVDVLILPTTTDVAWELGKMTNDPVEMYLTDIFTVLANLTGIPAISIPLGRDEQNLPYGVTLMSKRFDEKSLFENVNFVRELINNKVHS